MPARPTGSFGSSLCAFPETSAFESSRWRLFYVLSLLFVLDRISAAADGMDSIYPALKVNR